MEYYKQKRNGWHCEKQILKETFKYAGKNYSKMIVVYTLNNSKVKKWQRKGGHYIVEEIKNKIIEIVIKYMTDSEVNSLFNKLFK